jgi:hypothetical protein
MNKLLKKNQALALYVVGNVLFVYEFKFDYRMCYF